MESGMKSKKKSKSDSLVVKKMHSKRVYTRIRKIIEDARGNIARVVNTEMVIAYWQIGKAIIDEEQQGKSRADYGKKLLVGLARRLSDDFGKGFDSSNLWNMRRFYQTYPILDALR
ncbi:MAG: DUF1016 N-terminal domain-containing protein [Elusimicrobiota bacterium]|nr:DUF1016 N-terminal domain-containing protein [Elusimicrobiota bacterium]